MERFERREAKKLAERQRIKKHGKNIAVMYKNTTEKRNESKSN
jgi:hypothetical protein